MDARNALMQQLCGAYLAPVSYYSHWLRLGEVDIDPHAPYRKQSIRTRCQIDSPQGVLTLSIPVEKMEGSTLLRDVRISDHGNWRHQHWQALCSSYRHSPFFDYYADELAPFYEHRWDFLLDYNTALHQLVCQWMNLEAMPQLPPRPLSDTYYQVFASRHGFLPNLSIIDILCNMGPEAVLYL